MKTQKTQKTQITDPVLIEQAIKKLSNYAFDDEVRDFNETFPDYPGFDSQWSYEDAIEYVEGIPGGTDHILYSMLIIKSYLNFDGTKSLSKS